MEIRKVCVLGAGRRGNGIARGLAQACYLMAIKGYSAAADADLTDGSRYGSDVC